MLRILSMSCNAGIREITPAIDIAIEDWRKIIDINVNDFYHCSNFCTSLC